MKGLSSTTPPAMGLQASAAACTPKKGEGTGRAIKRQRCRLKPLRPELRSPVFAGLVADRKSSASKPPQRCCRLSRPHQNWCAGPPEPDQDKCPPPAGAGWHSGNLPTDCLQATEKEKPHYQIDSGVSFVYLGWLMGLEPTTTGITILDSTN